WGSVDAVPVPLGPDDDAVVREDGHAAALLPQARGGALAGPRGPEEQESAAADDQAAGVYQHAPAARQAGQEDHLVEGVDEWVELVLVEDGAPDQRFPLPLRVFTVELDREVRVPSEDRRSEGQ